LGVIPLVAAGIDRPINSGIYAQGKKVGYSTRMSARFGTLLPRFLPRSIVTKVAWNRGPKIPAVRVVSNAMHGSVRGSSNISTVVEISI
jgi:hypothetical protein